MKLPTNLRRSQQRSQQKSLQRVKKRLLQKRQLKVKKKLKERKPKKAQMPVLTQHQMQLTIAKMVNTIKEEIIDLYR